MALSNLGLTNNIVDVDNPTTKTEEVFNQYYELVLRKLLKRERPQFAIYDDKIPAEEFADHTWHYMVPDYMLEVLRVNGSTEGWTIEHGEVIADGYAMAPAENTSLDVKYVRFIDDTGLFTDEWVDLFSWELIAFCAGRLTQDSNMLQLAATGAQSAKSEYQTANLRSAKPRLKTQNFFNAIWRR